MIVHASSQNNTSYYYQTNERNMVIVVVVVLFYESQPNILGRAIIELLTLSVKSAVDNLTFRSF